ncbi:MAG TPA: hypothetical protein VFU36_14920, partial [Jatrophihabitans sp.]|nr:hypothetical protein [Jatrophihabitans sp.]
MAELTATPVAEPVAPVTRPRLRAVGSGIGTGLAFAVVWLALIAPDRLEQFRPAGFVRIPVEGLLLLALAVLLPVRPRRAVMASLGVLLGLLTLIRILDLGFFEELDRPFNPVIDWGNIAPAVGVLRDSIGRGWTELAVTGALLLVAGLVAAVTLSMLRISRVAARHRGASLRAVAVLGLVWALCAGFGVQLVPGTPVAASSAARLAADQVHNAQAAVADQQRFSAALAATDPASRIPADRLLAGLRGKDVIVAFVESYGEVAVQDSSFSAGVDATLAAGTRTLAAAGFGSRSAFLDSPTFGGI